MKDESNSIQSLIDELNEEKFNFDDFPCGDYNFGFNDGVDFAIDKITTFIPEPSRLPAVQPEPLTDIEQRIFLAAMAREEKVCKQTDDELRNCREPYEVSLVSVCHEITRKVKGALWSH